MSDKFIFQNARIKAMESRLLSQQQLQRVLDCQNLTECFKTLTELGFGGGQVTDLDGLFETEEKTVTELLKSFNVDGVLNPFLLTCDYHNLKVLMKAYLTGNKNPVLMSEGVVVVQDMKSALEGENVDVPKEMAKVIADLGLAPDSKISPRKIDVEVDRGMFRHILKASKKSGKDIHEYFLRKIDYANIGTFARVKKLGLDLDFVKDSFVEGGRINLDSFERIFDSPLDALKEVAKNTPYLKAVEVLVEKGALVEYEVEVDNSQLYFWKEKFNDLFSPAPTIYYYLAKLCELRVIKLIVAGVKNQVDPALIKERMREIYGA